MSGHFLRAVIGTLLLALAALCSVEAAAQYNRYAGMTASKMEREVCEDADGATAASLDRVDARLAAIKASESAEIVRLAHDRLGMLSTGSAQRLVRRIGRGDVARDELDQVLERAVKADGRSLLAFHGLIDLAILKAAMRRLNVVIKVIARTRKCREDARTALTAPTVPAAPAAAPWDGFWREFSTRLIYEVKGRTFYYQGTGDVAFTLRCDGVGKLRDRIAAAAGTYAGGIEGLLCFGDLFRAGGMAAGKVGFVLVMKAGRQPILAGLWSTIDRPDIWYDVTHSKLTDAQVEEEGVVPYKP